MRSLYTPIARLAPEAWGVLLVLGFVGFTGFEENCLGCAIACGVLGLAVARYCYDAPRNTIARPTGVMAPVDGTIAFRRECHDPWLGREAIRIGIKVAPLSNYLLRAPMEGEVAEVPGAPRTVSHLLTDEGEDLVVVVSKGLMLGARPLWAPIGERLGQGKRCGVRRGARWIDVYLPANARVEVQMGQAVKSAETVLATLLRK